MKKLTIHTDELAAMIERGEALWAQPGWGYAAVATGPTDGKTVRLAGPENFEPDAERPGYYTASYDLPDWPLSS